MEYPHGQGEHRVRGRRREKAGGGGRGWEKEGVRKEDKLWKLGVRA